MSFSRQSFLRAGGLLLAGSLLEHSLGWAIGQSAIVRRKTLWAMGGWNYLEAEAADRELADEALRHAASAIRRVDRLYSVFDRRSVIAGINDSSVLNVAIDDEIVMRSVARSLELANATSGAFDPTVEGLMQIHGYRETHGRTLYGMPNHTGFQCDLRHGVIRRESPSLALDTGGWAKGMAAEDAASAGVAAGATAVQINCGLDIVRHGRGMWTCGIRHPRGAVTDIAVDCRHSYRAVATSANTETWRTDTNGRNIGHLMDPRTAGPAHSDLASVTVFANDGLTADALASGLFVMGTRDAAHWLRNHPDIGAVLIPSDWNENTSTLIVVGDVECTEPAVNKS